MRQVTFRGAVFGLAALVGVMAQAQGTFVLTDTFTGTTHTFTNSLGTATLTNGMIVFEGELKSDLVVSNAYVASKDAIFASIKLLAQVRLFDELPSSNEVGAVQGAVAALRDSPTSGKYYVWATTNSAPVAWVPLMGTNNMQLTVNDGATNYITFVFNYHTNIAVVTYQMFIGVTASSMEPSLTNTSVTAEMDGINGVSLLGVGGLETVGSASGDPGPLSTEIGFSVYDTASGIVMVIDTVNESGKLPIKVYAWMKVNGVWQWQWVGEVPADQVFGEGAHRYQISAFPNSGLVAGEKYKFKIVDESGNTHSSGIALEISGTKMESVIFELDTMIISFNTEMNHDYLVKVADSPAAPSGDWTVQLVSQNINGVWSAYSALPFTAGGPTTYIKIPISSDKNKAFFKVFKVN